MVTYRLQDKPPILTRIALSVKRGWVKFRYGILLLLFFAGLLVFMRWALPVVIEPRLHQFFAIESIQVSGKIAFAPSERIHEVLQVHVDRKALYQVDVVGLQEELASIPWIESVDLERVWPHDLMISVKETVPIALWNENQIISNRGDVFEPDDLGEHASLPSLLGADSQVSMVTSMYGKTSKILRKVRLKLVEIEFHKGLEWRLGVVDPARENHTFILVLDGEQTFDRLYRFVSHYPSLVKMDQRPKRVDLRYPTGMAVSWQES